MGCAHLATLSNLTSLNLSQNEDITNRGAASIAALSNLKALNLSKTRVDSGELLGYSSFAAIEICLTLHIFFISGALKYFSGLLKLQSLALYGCRDVVESPRLQSLQSELPLLRCIRLNSALDEDGVVDHDDNSDEEIYDSYDNDDYTNDDDDDDAVASYQRSLLQHDHLYQHNTESGESSLLSEESMSAMGEFEDAYNEAVGSLEDEENIIYEPLNDESVASA